LEDENGVTPYPRKTDSVISGLRIVEHADAVVFRVRHVVDQRMPADIAELTVLLS